MSWIYDRLHTLTGRSYLQSKVIWLNEVVESLGMLIFSEADARKDFQRRRGVTPEQALLDTQQDIDRVEQLLAEKP